MGIVSKQEQGWSLENGYYTEFIEGISIIAQFLSAIKSNKVRKAC